MHDLVSALLLITGTSYRGVPVICHRVVLLPTFHARMTRLACLRPSRLFIASSLGLYGR